MKLWIILLIILVVLIGILVFLYFYGKKAQKKQDEQKAQLEAAKQPYSMLIIDKKRLPLKDSGLPAAVIEQTPKRFRKTKVPVVKAKIGPKIMSLIADEKIFDDIPLKREVKAEVSGIYILSVKGLRGKVEAAPVKKGFFARTREKLMKKAGM
ncbi:MAG: hypothetical protein ACOX71_08405 [Lachnospiraceae bacterium]